MTNFRDFKGSIKIKQRYIETRSTKINKTHWNHTTIRNCVTFLALFFGFNIGKLKKLKQGRSYLTLFLPGEGGISPLIVYHVTISVRNRVNPTKDCLPKSILEIN